MRPLRADGVHDTSPGYAEIILIAVAVLAIPLVVIAVIRCCRR
jgi:hypothetical protein